MPLDRYIGEAEVIEGANREKILASTCKRILLKGCEGIDEGIAELICEKGLYLLGVEGQSVGSGQVHRSLLSCETVLLEGIRLGHVPEGIYTLVAAPLKLGGFEGAPCRAILLDEVN